MKCERGTGDGFPASGDVDRLSVWKEEKGGLFPIRREGMS
jgi:hypothetical protein